VTNKLRSHRLLAITLLLLILCAVTTPLAQTPTDPTEEYDVVKIDTNLVTLNVSVTKKDHPVTGLVTEDFQILDNGANVKPEFFDAQSPASIIFVLDVSTSMRGERWKNLRRGLKQFLKEQKEASDYTLITFNECPRLISQSIDASDFWKIFTTLKPDGETALYDGLSVALDQTRALPRRNKAIVLLSDGEDNRSSNTLATVQQKVLATNTTIYAVGLLLDKRKSGPESRGQKLLIDVAASTGGLSFFPTAQEIEKTLQKITADITNQYSFGYYPLNKTPGWRTVEVNLLKTNLRRSTKLRYQKRYMFK